MSVEFYQCNRDIPVKSELYSGLLNGFGLFPTKGRTAGDCEIIIIYFGILC